MQIYIIRSLPDPHAKQCIESLLKTSGGNINANDISVIDEDSTREDTLNQILSQHNQPDDLFIVADDIRFHSGWFEVLQSNLGNGDIIGFSMVNPQTGLLQDFGYDFIDIDGKLSYRGLHKHEHPDSVTLPQFRECDSITGCAMYIKRSVLKKVDHFPIEGMNRWGEMLYCVAAKRVGFKILVLSFHLDHTAISTKQKLSVEKSSLSWLVERDLWENVVNTYLTHILPRQYVNRSLDQRLRHQLETANFPLIYGCGTIADFIIDQTQLEKFVVCSGLAEEVGAKFHDHKVQDIKKLDLRQHDLILITPIGYDGKILPYFTVNKNTTIIGIRQEQVESTLIFLPRDLE